MTNDENEFTLEVLTKFFTEHETRLANALKLRDEMRTKLEKGEAVTGYRYDFLVESAEKVITFLGVLAEDFDTKYGYDRCTNYDFVDILATAIARIKKASTDGQ